MSDLLREAQARLMARRQALGIIPKAQEVEKRPFAPISQLPKGMDTLPHHLGWGDERLTAVLRAKHTPPSPSERTQSGTLRHTSTRNPSSRNLGSRSTCAQCTKGVELPAEDPIPIEIIPTPDPANPEPPATLRLYPTLAMAILKGELVAPARVWLLCRLLDEDGCGWVELTAVRHTFTSPKSNYRLCGKRQLRNLLHAGEGLFWQRVGDRLWLRSVQRVADTLAVPRLTGLPIKLPVQTLLGSMQTVRAHFYASFHSGRTEQPIARETLTAVGGLSPDSQRRYEKAVGIQPTANYAIGHKATPNSKEDIYGRYGYAAFQLTDKKGKQGKAGATYMAWQLPNSYKAIHLTTNKGNQRGINSQLADLSMKGMTGNGRWQAKRFYADGKSAARLYNRREHEQTIYWAEPCGKRRQRIWYGLEPY